ncbi:pyridoxamine 5'-phosphate oxidase family protein [Caballeronia sp. LZ065]|uniref:pyridoxamine 5'-phosphate oxidase family protein n=1 Tax=Caballeronia sp. LZ065 TaxID=3038571 RepID=UPI00285E1B37|nr:pyridoxamine 5'-phosphate oxidase family protein [Caballeronia sp. LZ065]MDR5781644.1 pyridoxamine 5'-phosphate oxidase family protein [Caballeronia sp. LZ065]
MLNDTISMAMKKSVLCWLATVDRDGYPNVSPKEIFCPHGRDELLIANIASPKSASNIRLHAAVCVSFVDPFVQKGFKLTGNARLMLNSEHGFDALAAPLAKLAGPRFAFASLFQIALTSVEPILAPSYRLYPETKECEQIESAMQAYGVRPVQLN